MRRRWRSALVLGWALSAMPARAETTLDPMIGIRFAHYVAQSALASPPLPNLVDESQKENFHVTPSVAYLPGYLLPPADNSYDGSFTDWSFAFGLTHDTAKHLSLFAFGMVSRMSAEVNTNFTADGTVGVSTTFLDNMKNLGYNFAGGFSYRLLSMRVPAMAFGVMAGPYFSKFKSEFRFLFSDPPRTYGAEPVIYGAVVGAQAYLKLWGIQLRPHIVYYRDFSNRCETFTRSTSDAPEDAGIGIGDACAQADSTQLTLDGTFWAYGLRVGLYGFSVSVYQKINTTSTLDSIRGTRYSASYTLDF